MKTVAVDDVFKMNLLYDTYELRLYKNGNSVRKLLVEKNSDVAFNRLVSQHLWNGTLSGNSDGFVTGVTTDADAVGHFELKWNLVTVKEDDYLNAWTDKPIGNEQLISAPVNGHLDPRMYLFFTTVAESDINVQLVAGNYA